jgi:ABC-2 type transport system ATP-binding protein
MGKLIEVNIESAGYGKEGSIIENIRFSMEAGDLVGLIGPNGAGKSTTIKSILGLLSDMKGEIRFKDGRKSCAYVPEHPVWYEELTLWEHLELAAAVYELDPSGFAVRAEKLLRQFRLLEVKHHLPGSFSKGMQQKMMLVLGFLSEPDVYIVDEPFIGLDPKAIKDLLDLLMAERERGAAVLMCTHVLDTAERICNSFLLMSEGRLVANGSLEQIRQQCGMPEGTLFECFHSIL